MQFLFKKITTNFYFTVCSVLILASLNSCEEEPQLPVPDFSFNNNVTAPAVIEFKNESLFSEKYVWDFGDGTASDEESPSHIYYVPGSYTVTLKALYDEGSTSISKTVRITGITVIVLNSSSIDLPEVFICYDNGVELTDFIQLGNVPSGHYSIPCYTDRESMIAGFRDPVENALYLTAPQHLVQNTDNVIEIHDYSTLYKIVLE